MSLRLLNDPSIFFFRFSFSTWVYIFREKAEQRFESAGFRSGDTVSAEQVVVAAAALRVSNEEAEALFEVAFREADENDKEVADEEGEHRVCVTNLMVKPNSRTVFLKSSSSLDSTCN